MILRIKTAFLLDFLRIMIGLCTFKWERRKNANGCHRSHVSAVKKNFTEKLLTNLKQILAHFTSNYSYCKSVNTGNFYETWRLSLHIVIVLWKLRRRVSFLETRNTSTCIHVLKSFPSAILNCHTFNCKLTCSFLRYELMFSCCSGCQSVKSMLVFLNVYFNVNVLLCYFNICELQQIVFDNKIYPAGYFYMQMRTMDKKCFSWVSALFLYSKLS